MQTERMAVPAPPAPSRPTPAPLTVPDQVSGPVHAGLIAIGLFFGGLGAWSAVAPVAGAALAPGVTRVEGNRQSLQHRDGGIVRRILVKEGNKVERGKVLLLLDDTAARARLDMLTAQRDALKALEARLIAEREDREPAFDVILTDRRGEPAVADLMASQRALFLSRKNQFGTEVAVLNKKVAQLREQIAGTLTEADGLERQISLIREELTDFRGLYEKGYAPKTRVLALERTEARLMADRGAKLADVAKAGQAIGETELTIARTEHARLTEVTDQLRDTRTKLVELEPRVTEALEVLQRTWLVAPVAGEVVGLTIFTEGGVIAPGARVLDIVPARGTLVIEARVRPEDVHDIATGAAAEIRLTGMIGRQRPALTGTVDVVSADRLADARSGEPYYAAQVRIEPSSLEQARVTLQAGMPADVLIATKSRTVLEYLISPLSDQIARAFREQ
jgi:HlyD family type I secretion membrane fusion protein